MKRDLQTITAQILPILKKAGVSRSFVFGSYARNEATDESDLDLLVEFKDRKTLLDVAELYLDLEEELDMKVDVLTPDAIYAPLLPYINRDKQRIL